jgi:MFS family permease
MPIVSFLERKKISKIKNILWGSLFMTLGYFILTFDSWVSILILSVILLTFGEIFSFPFTNAIALNRAPKGQEGKYMGLYTMSFSLAHILSAKGGLEIVSRFGYQTNWIVMGSCGLLGVFACLWLQKLTQLEQNQPKAQI